VYELSGDVNGGDILLAGCPRNLSQWTYSDPTRSIRRNCRRESAFSNGLSVMHAQSAEGPLLSPVHLTLVDLLADGFQCRFGGLVHALKSRSIDH